MKRAWLICGIVFFALAAFTLYSSFEYSYKDRLGPGPGFFPFWLSLITGALSMALIIQTARANGGNRGTDRILPKREALLRIAYIIAGLIGVLIFLNFLGFRIVLFLFLLVLPALLGIRTWWLIAILAVAGSFGVFHIFYYWLKLPLPMGVFGI
ncbi:MAG: tripartite tricarboxylate transporter TctB family protein [Desulfobacteraceae bacterium]|nr:MAG: tripartite tricarboxylate transporter TctB family protein [Desulfobacteraceae bacterium]